MNYPVWDVAFGAGLLMALVSILHVFVSHFAVGGGLFLVVTERKARREGDAQLLEWLKFHTRFFVLLTVVFGAVSGVGIWFTIALINPTATANLIHAFVWGWAIEWVFFFLEITAALLYLYGWDRLPPQLHLWYGWLYFGAAFASMLIINGIITFMLTPGRWVATHAFWTGFFNPTYFQSLVARFAIALALAGIYAVLTASMQKDTGLKARLVKWSAAWMIPALALLPALMWLYARSLPAEAWSGIAGRMPTAARFGALAAILGGVTFALAVMATVKPAKLGLARSIPLLVAALAAMGSFEFVREAARKPFVIGNYLYANSVYAMPLAGDGGFTVENMNRAGVLATAKWVSRREIGDTPARAGAEIFRVECQACHTRDAYRGLKQYLVARQWDKDRIAAMLGSLDVMHGGAMCSFAGTEAERAALAAWLDEVRGPLPQSAAKGGAAVFERNCSVCHETRPTDPVFMALTAMDAQSAREALAVLPELYPRMPDLKLSDGERAALVAWVDGKFTRR